VRRDAASAAGLLAGLPFTVKDALCVAGMPATAGSRLLVDHVPAADAPVVARLRGAGAVVVGKTNCAEFALAPLPGNELFGVTLNPADESLSVGGSSCGCAAAVASGLVPFSVGSDYGGSVRYPAQCAGIVGFRPALGSVDGGGQVPAPPPGSPRARFSVPGLLCRDLDTLEDLLRVLMPDELQVQGMRTHRLDTGFLAAADAAFSAIRSGDDVADLRALARGRESLLTPAMRALVLGDRVPLAPVAPPALPDAPVLLAPVTAGPTPLLRDSADTPEHVDALFRLLAPCRAITLYGLHAISVPRGDGSSVQVVTRRGNLGAALRVARAVAA